MTTASGPDPAKEKMTNTEVETSRNEEQRLSKSVTKKKFERINQQIKNSRNHNNRNQSRKRRRDRSKLRQRSCKRQRLVSLTDDVDQHIANFYKVVKWFHEKTMSKKQVFVTDAEK